MPTDVRELLERLGGCYTDTTCACLEHKLGDLWPETRAVIEAAEGALVMQTQYADIVLRTALTAWAKKAEEVTGDR